MVLRSWWMMLNGFSRSLLDFRRGNRGTDQQSTSGQCRCPLCCCFAADGCRRRSCVRIESRFVFFFSSSFFNKLFLKLTELIVSLLSLQGSCRWEVRHEQLLRDRDRCQDHAGLPHETGGASGEMSIQGPQLHVVRRLGQQRMATGIHHHYWIDFI